MEFVVHHTVDGRNPAPPGMYELYDIYYHISWLTGILATVSWQYHGNLLGCLPKPTHPREF